MSRVARYVVTGGVMDLTIYIALLAPLLAVQWHLRKLDLALLPLSWGVVYSLTAIFGGRLSDRISRTGSMRGAAVLFILSCGIFFTADAGQVWLLYLGMPVVALAMALFWPALQAAIADESKARWISPGTSAIRSRHVCAPFSYVLLWGDTGSPEVQVAILSERISTSPSISRATRRTTILAVAC